MIEGQEGLRPYEGKEGSIRDKAIESRKIGECVSGKTGRNED